MHAREQLSRSAHSAFMSVVRRGAAASRMPPSRMLPRLVVLVAAALVPAADALRAATTTRLKFEPPTRTVARKHLVCGTKAALLSSVRDLSRAL